MFDKDTLIISYDDNRGEPRGARARAVDHHAKGLGDCINCTMCVQVCPTGIDIREGLQYECIACAACVDICDNVMETMGYEPGLIRYTRDSSSGTHIRVLRPRILIYATVLIATTLAFFWLVFTRTPLEVDVLKDRNALFRPIENGKIENVYTIKIVNMDREDHIYDVQITGVPGLTFDLGNHSTRVEAGQVASIPVRVRADPSALTAVSTQIEFHVTARENSTVNRSESARFLGWQKQ